MSIPEPDEEQPHEPGDKMVLLMKSVRENCAVQFVKDADEEGVNALRSVNWFVDCGDDDFLLDRNIELRELVRPKHIFEHRFRRRSGEALARKQAIMLRREYLQQGIAGAGR